MLASAPHRIALAPPGRTQSARHRPAPLKAPLIRVCRRRREALGQIDQVTRAISSRSFNWTTLAGAVLLTRCSSSIQTIHLHGLAASKTNVNSTEKPALMTRLVSWLLSLGQGSRTYLASAVLAGIGGFLFLTGSDSTFALTLLAQGGGLAALRIASAASMSYLANLEKRLDSAAASWVTPQAHGPPSVGFPTPWSTTMKSLFTYCSLLLATSAAVVGGPVHPDGTEVDCDLPAERHLQARGGSDGAGLCVFTSIAMAADWCSEPPLVDFRDWMRRRPGGGYPGKSHPYDPRPLPGTRSPRTQVPAAPRQ